MIGHLEEISPWLDFAKSSWTDKEGKGRYGWEEMPYWLKGYGDLGYVLKDQAIIADTRKWIEAAMASQREDGCFGPRELLASLNGKPDLWPHMVMLNILQSYYEFTGEPRVLDVMNALFQMGEHAAGHRLRRRVLAEDSRRRQIESIYWLYNRLGPDNAGGLLDLARKIHEHMAALGRGRHQLAQRQHRPGLPRRHGLWDAGSEPGSPLLGRAQLRRR